MSDIVEKVLKNSKTIAIVGLSPNEEKDSYKVGKYLIENDYNIIPIYPKEEKILNRKVYRSLEEIKENIDTVVMFRKAEFAKPLYEQIKKRKDVKYLWLQLGIENFEVEKKAKEGGLGFVQNKCIMIEHLKRKN